MSRRSASTDRGEGEDVSESQDSRDPPKDAAEQLLTPWKQERVGGQTLEQPSELADGESVFDERKLASPREPPN